MITEKEFKNRCADILRNNITFSGQIGDYVIHGALDALWELHTEQNSHKHGVGGPASASVSEGEQLGNEALGKAGAVEVLEIKTGQILKVNGYGFVFGTDNHNAQPICFNLENVSGESRDGALH